MGKLEIKHQQLLLCFFIIRFTLICYYACVEICICIEELKRNFVSFM